MTKQMLHKFIDDCWDEWKDRGNFDPNEAEIETKEEKPYADTAQSTTVEVQTQTEEKPKETPKGLRVVRTKSTGDKVYVLNEEKQTKKWLPNPEAVEALGFTMGDVEEMEDLTFAKYRLTME